MDEKRLILDFIIESDFSKAPNPTKYIMKGYVGATKSPIQFDEFNRIIKALHLEGFLEKSSGPHREDCYALTYKEEKAEFTDTVLKLFNETTIIRQKELERKFRHDSYLYYQTKKHLKILEADGLIRNNEIPGEYYLQTSGARVLNDIHNIG